MASSRRRGEGAAIATLAAAMAAHQIAETARDALFLRELGPTRLPFVYLVLALIGIPIALVPARFASSRAWLTTIMFVTAAVSASFFWMSGREWGFVYESLYVFTGLSASVFVTFFWLLLGGRYSVTRAKTVFPRIALGGIAGALAGATIARSIAGISSPRHLLLGAAALQIGAGTLALGLKRIGDLPFDRIGHRTSTWPIMDMFRRAIRSRYARVVGAILLLASLTLTLVDYTFKSVVSEHVPKEELGSTLATFYLILNFFSLVSMVLLARRFLLWVGLTSVVLLLPSLILLGATGVLAGGGLVAALLLKGADGSLRHSLHRTSTELLFVPMRESTRRVVKPLLDIAIKPAGQAVASLLILLMLQLSTKNSVYAIITMFFSLVWIACGVRLRGLYLDVFRRTLRADSIDLRPDLPKPNVDSLAIAEKPLASDIPLLIHLLSLRPAREHARRALLELGEPALEHLVRALKDPNTPLSVRIHLPRTISRFPPERAAPILIDCVATESDELVLHKALRGLGRIDATRARRPLHRERLLDACEAMIVRTLLLIQIRATLERSHRDAEGPARTIREALIGLLSDAEHRGIEHVFLALHLLHPTENMEHLFRGITSGDVTRRSSSEELLLHLVDRRLRDGLAALISDAPDERRLEIASEQYELVPLDERSALERLIALDIAPLRRAAMRYREVLRLPCFEVA